MRANRVAYSRGSERTGEGCQKIVNFNDFGRLIQGDTSRCPKPPVDFKTKVPFWPGLTWPGQSRTFVLKSTGGFEQRDVSPCTVDSVNLIIPFHTIV